MGSESSLASSGGFRRQGMLDKKYTSRPSAHGLDAGGFSDCKDGAALSTRSFKSDIVELLAHSHELAQQSEEPRSRFGLVEGLGLAAAVTFLLLVSASAWG